MANSLTFKIHGTDGILIRKSLPDIKYIFCDCHVLLESVT